MEREFVVYYGHLLEIQGASVFTQESNGKVDLLIRDVNCVYKSKCCVTSVIRMFYLRHSCQ